MSYYTQKTQRDKELRRIKFIVMLILAGLFLCLSVFSFFVPPDAWQYHFALPNVARRQEGELRIHYLDVGQADATLIEFPDGKTLLIDTGDTHSDAIVLRYINALKIKKLDYLLLTHIDSDHCGGAYEVMKYKGAECVILPKIENNSAYKTSYSQFEELLNEQGIEGKVADRFDKIVSSDERYPYNFTILFPNSVEDEDKYSNNELSTISYLQYGDIDALFCGDTTAEILKWIMLEDSLGAFEPQNVNLNDIELFKVPHHGAKNVVTDVMLNYFKTDVAIISCGVNNLYGHPHEETLGILSATQTQIYRTDLQGTIMATVRQNGDYTMSMIK